MNPMAIAAIISSIAALANTGVNYNQSRQINKNKAMAAKNRGAIVKYDKYKKRYYTYR